MNLLEASADELDVDASIEAFRRDGFARLGKRISSEGLAALRERADDLMMGRVRYDGLFFQHDTETGDYRDLDYGKGWVGPSPNYRKLEKLEMDPVFLGLIENALFRRVVGAVIGDDVTIYRATLFNKGAAGGSDLPWHQDGGKFWGLDREPTLQIWTALDDASVEAGCVEIVPGSHEPGLATPLGGRIPEDIVRARDAEARRIHVPCEAGEVLLIHNHVWHRSGKNATGRPRRAFTVTYMDGLTRCLRAKREPRRFFRLWARPEAEYAAGGEKR